MEDFRKRVESDARPNASAEPNIDVIRAMETRQQNLEHQVAIYRNLLKSLAVKRVDDPEGREQLIENVKELCKQLGSLEAERDRLNRELADSRDENTRLREELQWLTEQSKDWDMGKNKSLSRDRGFEFDR